MVVRSRHIQGSTITTSRRVIRLVLARGEEFVAYYTHTVWLALLHLVCRLDWGGHRPFSGRQQGEYLHVEKV